MGSVRHARGGDGWSTWTVNLLRSGPYEVFVTSHAEKNQDGTAKDVFRSEDIRDWRAAIDKAISESTAYAYRMFQ